MNNKEELMKTYLLFLYSFFETHEDAENFSFDILGKCPIVKKVRFIKEDDSKNLIMIFESDATKKEISEELRKILTEDTVKFYFLFDRNNIASANLPAQMKEFMFNPQEENVSLRLEYDDSNGNNSSTNMDLDTILEKLSEFGIESLTRNEKKFLDNFKN